MKLFGKNEEPIPDPIPENPEERAKEMLKEMREMNRLLKLNAATMGEFRYRFFGGLYQGLGTVIGATVVIAIIVRILARLATLETLGPYIREVQGLLDRTPPPNSAPAKREGANAETRP